MTTRIAIAGAAGRMGRRLMALAADDPKLELVQALEYEGHPMMGKPVGAIEPGTGDVALSAKLTGGAEVLIDFSVARSAAAMAEAASATGTALVLGTTGLEEAALAAVEKAAGSIPVVHAPNFSLGVNLLFKIAGEVAKALGDDFDIEITESHHNQKADAPSGTALGIARSICTATGRNIDKDLVNGRSGKPGPRTKREIGMHALRLGSVIGEHTAHFGSLFERLELTHRAETRDVFAAGALRTAKWLAGKKAGRYSMEDVLFGG